MDRALSNKIDLYLVFSLIAGFALRATGISWGMYYPDEHIVINHAMAFGTGDLNPHFFVYPTLLMYGLFFCYGIFYLAGYFLHFFQTPDDFLRLYLLSPHTFYVLGRCVSVLFGTATIWVCYRLVGQYANRTAARIAAILTAVCFLHVRDSHFVVTDIPLTFFMTLALYFVIRSLDTRRLRDLVWASLFTGIAAAIKYNAFILALPIAGAYFLIERFRVFRFLRHSLALALIALAAFALGTPYVFLDFPAASSEILHQLEVNRGFDIKPWRHLVMLYYGLDLYIFVVFLIGLAMALARPCRKAVLMIVYFGVYYYLITKAGQPFERYVMPLIPIAILYASVALEKLAVSKKPIHRVLLAAVIGLTLIKTVSSDILFLKTDTRDLCAKWIHANVPPKKTIVLDNAMDCPKLTATQEQIEQKIMDLKEQNALDRIKERRLKTLLQITPYPEHHYTLFYFGVGKTGQFSLLGPYVPHTLEALRSVGTDYVIADVKAIRREASFYEQLKQVSEVAATFDPRKNPEKPMTRDHWTALPIDDFFWNYERPGPLIYLFKLKKESFLS